jgi:predicted dienelactone hydrolase
MNYRFHPMAESELHDAARRTFCTTGAFMNRVYILAGLILSANALVQSLGAEPQAAPYKMAAGPYVVETVVEVVLHDAQRKKDLPVFVSYPKGDGKFPVIVLSHGAMGSGDMGFPIVQHWTSHGYVVLCPTHADSIKLQRGAGRDAAAGARGSLLSRALGSGRTGLAGPSGDQKAIFEWVKQATTAFWDGALQAAAAAKAWLASDALVNQSGHQARLERR